MSLNSYNLVYLRLIFFSTPIFMQKTFAP